MRQSTGPIETAIFKPPGESRIRWRICALLFFATTINYMDRQIIGVLKPTLQHDLGWNEIDFSNVIFWFQVAYAGGYLFGGRLMDVLGVRLGYALSVLCWSIAAMSHGLASTVFGFSAARFGLGAAEGGNFPAAIKTVSEWFPRRERSFATGIFNSGSNVGAILTPLLVPWVTVKYGWQAAFFITGALGLLWLAAWGIVYRLPEDHTGVSDSELAHIRGDGPERSETISWLGLLRFHATWAFIAAQGLSSPIWWFYLYWVPGFLDKRYHLDLIHMGLPLAVIYLVSDVGSIAGGWFPARLIRRGWSINSARKTAMLLCAICALPVSFVARVEHEWMAVAILSLAAAAHQGWSANCYTLVSDTMPRRAVSSVVGMGGMVGAVLGMFIAKAVGYVLQWSGNYTLLFASASSVYLLALIFVQVLCPRLEPVEIIPMAEQQ